MRVLCFTALFGEDGSQPIDIPKPFEKICESWDYIMLTNYPAEVFPADLSWTLKHVPHPTEDYPRGKHIYANRWFKWHPWLIGYYDVYIYIDARQAPSIQYKIDWLELCKIANSGNRLIHCTHDVHQCIYTELKEILKARKDTVENMDKVCAHISSHGMPENEGMFWNGCYVLSRGAIPIIKPIWSDLWKDMLKLTYRDQSLYMFHVWKNTPALMDVLCVTRLDNIVVETDDPYNHFYTG